MQTPVQLPWFQRGDAYDLRAQGLPWHITDLGLQNHWEKTGGGDGILVGIADTGIDPDHPYIAGRIDHQFPVTPTRVRREPDIYDGNGHGTHVATMVARMAPSCRFAIAKVLGDNGSGWNSDVAEGIRNLVDAGCHIINLSLGGPQDDAATRSAVFYGKSKGCIFVIASGNEGANAIGYPSQHGVAIGAIDRANRLANWSNRGVHLDAVGYGVNILSGVPGGGEQLMSGTSMAAPCVTGIATNRLSLEIAVLGGVYTNSDDRLMELETFVHDLGPAGRDTGFGRGRPDLDKLFDLQAAEPDPDPDPTDDEKESIEVSIRFDDGRYFHGDLEKAA